MNDNENLERIKCELCGAKVLSIASHLKNFHSETSLEEYKNRFPDAPLISPIAEYKLKKIQEIKEETAKAKETADQEEKQAKDTKDKLPMHIVFEMNKEECLASNQNPIQITRLPRSNHSQTEDLVPNIDPNFVFSANELKDQLMAIELNIPCLVWGHKGTGKTEGIEQICARTHRAFMRVQHTANTEEAHIVGQWTVKNGDTVYQYGALPLAMIHGWLYCADEYDFATPHVLSVYQSVLEGKALVIKDAPEEMRIVKPHPNFRFFATGNTNGTGDESGLYAGTLTQNSANYDRFGMVVQKNYLEKSKEIEMLKKRCGLFDDEAQNLVEFATEVRKAFDKSKISDTISPRTLITASRIGILKGSFTEGLNCSFINKLSSVDALVAKELCQRIFGE